MRFLLTALLFLSLSLSLLHSTNSFTIQRVTFLNVRLQKALAPQRAPFTPQTSLKNHGAYHHLTTPLYSNVSEDESSDRNVGILVLLTVPFAWGTFEPAVRYVYEIDPPVPALVFSLGYYLVATLSLGLLAFINNQDTKSEETKRSIRGGLELGTYLFIGNGLQVLGLKTVPSDRAAFLLQLTTIFVPLVQATINKDLRSIPNKTWRACFIAFFGVAVIGLDGKEGPLLENAANVLTNFSQGDIFIMAAAFSYTFHCIRLEGFAKDSSAIQLAACKATTEMTWTLLLLGSIFCLSQGDTDLLATKETSKEIISFFQSTDLLSNPTLSPTILAIVWTGLVTVAYTIYAQSYGQARVSPTDANLIYTIQPICTAVFAWALLGETLGPAGYVGGALIGSAVYLVATDQGED